MQSTPRFELFAVLERLSLDFELQGRYVVIKVVQMLMVMN
jgi:hypothetical protein